MGPRMGGKAEHHGAMSGRRLGDPVRRRGYRDQGAHGHHPRDGVTGLLLSPWLLGGGIQPSIVAFYASARGLQDGEGRPGDRRDGNRRATFARDRRAGSSSSAIRWRRARWPVALFTPRVRAGRGRRRADAGARALGRRRRSRPPRRSQPWPPGASPTIPGPNAYALDSSCARAASLPRRSSPPRF